MNRSNLLMPKSNVVVNTIRQSVVEDTYLNSIRPKSNVVANTIRQPVVEDTCITRHHEYLSKAMNACGNAQRGSREANIKYGNIGR